MDMLIRVDVIRCQRGTGKSTSEVLGKVTLAYLGIVD